MFKKDGVTYTDRYEGAHQLSPKRVAELEAHFHQCEIPFLTCEQCFELFHDLGYAEYEKLALMYPEDANHI